MMIRQIGFHCEDVDTYNCSIAFCRDVHSQEYEAFTIETRNDATSKTNYYRIRYSTYFRNDEIIRDDGITIQYFDNRDNLKTVEFNLNECGVPNPSILTRIKQWTISHRDNRITRDDYNCDQCYNR